MYYRRNIYAQISAFTENILHKKWADNAVIFPDASKHQKWQCGVWPGHPKPQHPHLTQYFSRNPNHNRGTVSHSTCDPSYQVTTFRSLYTLCRVSQLPKK